MDPKDLVESMPGSWQNPPQKWYLGNANAYTLGKFQPNSREKRRWGEFFVVVRLQLLGKDWSCLVHSCLRWFTQDKFLRLIASIRKGWTCPTCFVKKGWHHFQDYVCLILSVTCRFWIAQLHKKGSSPLKKYRFLNKVPGPKQILMKLSIISPPAIWGQISGLVWESWVPPMKTKYLILKVIPWTHQWNVVFFGNLWVLTVGRFGGSRRFFSQLWRIMWTSELCMMLLGFFCLGKRFWLASEESFVS